MMLIIIGAGGYGMVVADLARQLNKYDKIAFLDDNSQAEQVVGKCASYVDYLHREAVEFYPALGNNELRLEWYNKLKDHNCKIATIVHPTAYVSPLAKIGEGTVVLPRACVNTDTIIKSCCIINMGALIDHNCVIEEGCHVCLGAVIKANNHLKACVKIEAGVVVERGMMG